MSEVLHSPSILFKKKYMYTYSRKFILLISLLQFRKHTFFLLF